MFGAPGPYGPGSSRGSNGIKRSAYGYASSIVSQDAGHSSADTGSVINDSGSSVNMTFSQSDRIRRRGSFGSSSVAGTSDIGSVSQYDYKSQDESADLDDMKSQYGGTQAGVTVF